MQPYDLVMIVVLVGATVFGAWKGMAWQLASLGSLVVSYFVALKFSPQLAPMFGAQAPLNRFLAMLVIYLLTSFLIWMAFRVVASVIDRVRLKEFDRQVGALFGAAKGVLLCVAITFFAVTLSITARGHILESRSGYYIAKFLNHAPAFMPPELHGILEPYMERLERELNPTSRPMTVENGTLAPLPPAWSELAEEAAAALESDLGVEPDGQATRGPIRGAIRRLTGQGE